MFPNEIYVIILLSLNIILQNSRERKHVAREETLELFLSVDIQPCTIGLSKCRRCKSVTVVAANLHLSSARTKKVENPKILVTKLA